MPTDREDLWANPRSVLSADDGPGAAQPSPPADAQQDRAATRPAGQPPLSTADAAARRGGDQPGSNDPLTDRVRELLDDLINPAVASHGGHIELVEVKNNRAYVRMQGGCQGCGAASMTLKAGVERMLREELPQIEEVVDTTDHSLGENPYYTSMK